MSYIKSYSVFCPAMSVPSITYTTYVQLYRRIVRDELLYGSLISNCYDLLLSLKAISSSPLLPFLLHLPLPFLLSLLLHLSLLILILLLPSPLLPSYLSSQLSSSLLLLFKLSARRHLSVSYRTRRN